MIATIWPGSTALAAGAVTCASTLPAATAMPTGRPVHRAASGVKLPTLSPSAAMGWSSFALTNVRKSGFSNARNSSEG